MADGAAGFAASVPEEEFLRARLYGLMARLLLAPPPADLLAFLRTLQDDDTEIGRALGQLAQAARNIPAADIGDEYHQLFIGVARGELVPYGSYYLTGFLNEKPLAKLRQDLARMGIARAQGVCEPEDHIGTLCEVMAALIAGEFGDPADLSQQQAFFRAHIEPWARRFFADLEYASAARFYVPVGRLGALLIDIETAGFDMAA